MGLRGEGRRRQDRLMIHNRSAGHCLGETIAASLKSA
jgi:hypothetical protein